MNTEILELHHERIGLQVPAHGFHRQQILAAVVLAVVVFAFIVILRALGLLYGFWILGALGVMLVLIPVSKHLAGRMLWALTVIFGFVPLLWWLPFEWPQSSRSTALLAAVTAVVVFFAVRVSFKLGGVRRLLPEFRLLDAVPFLFSLGGIFVFWHGLMVRQVEDALALMLMSWDNASHFDIFHMQRNYGTVIPLLGAAPDGSKWSLNDYPQGFHSVLVLLTELARPRPVGDGAADVVNFVNFTAVANVLVVVLVVSAVCSLPALRANPRVGIPVAVLVGSGWLFGFGALASMHGFSNFVFTTALVVAGIILSHTMTRIIDPIAFVAMGACVAAIVQNWVPLIVLLVPSILAVLFISPGRRWRASGREIVVVAGVTLLVGVAAATAAGQILAIQPAGVLFASGGVPEANLGTLIAILTVLGAASLIFGAQSPVSSEIRRTRWSISAVWVGLLVACGMAVAQLSKNGALSYYLQKFAIALALVGVVALAFVASGSLSRSPKVGEQMSASRSTRTIAVSLLLSVGASQAFGFILPLKDIGMAPTSHAGIEWDNQRKTLATGSPAAQRLIRAVEKSSGLQGPVMYLTTNPSTVDPVLAQQWFDGLRGNYTNLGYGLSVKMFPLSGGVEKLGEVVQAIRTQAPYAHLVVDPENQAILDQVLGHAS
ncbi:hypothetical protein [Arthrobacter sp. GMC3]|uniref:hypothetical protein n=1 Tax=Arthrobacter sp. GMC3 TaxID=2058894 RepID=UPI000CE3169D|nr:hypothetical protein [Arthrobacter sp. GMC3]